MFEINGKIWHIKFVSPSNKYLLKEDNTYTIGVCDNISKTIYLSSDLRAEKLSKVLIHELVHAIIFSYNIQLEYEKEELIANIISVYGEKIIKIKNKYY